MSPPLPGIALGHNEEIGSDSPLPASTSESGDPDSPHYSDLFEEWAARRYHPMAFSRKAVEAAASERIKLAPAQ